MYLARELLILLYTNFSNPWILFKPDQHIVIHIYMYLPAVEGNVSQCLHAIRNSQARMLTLNTPLIQTEIVHSRHAVNYKSRLPEWCERSVHSSKTGMAFTPRMWNRKLGRQKFGPFLRYQKISVARSGETLVGQPSCTIRRYIVPQLTSYRLFNLPCETIAR